MANNIPSQGLIFAAPLNGSATELVGNDPTEIVESNVLYVLDDSLQREVAEFNDFSSQIEYPAVGSLDEMTVALWVQFQDFDDIGQVICMNDGRMSIGFNDNNESIDVVSGTSFQSESTQEGIKDFFVPNVTFENQWRHITATFGNDSTSLFVDGQFITSGPSSESPFDTNILLGNRIFSSSLDYNFGGLLRDVFMWNRVLSPVEIITVAQPDPGCMDEAACNFNPGANYDDGSCDYCECVSPVVFGGNWNDVLISFGTNQLYTTWEDLDLSSIQGRGIRKIVGGEGYFLTLMEDSTVVTLCENCLYGNPPPSTWKVKDVEAGRHEGVLVRADGSLYSFGANYAGLSSEPSVNNAVQCAAASWFHMALLEDGEIVGWGDAWEPCPLELEDVIKIDASGDHAVALLESGKLVEWGRLGDGTVATSKDWILELNNVIDAIAGQSSTWIIFNDGSATRVSFPDGDIMMELPASSMTISGTGNWFSVSGHMNANGDVFVQKGGTQIDTTLDLSVYASCDVCIADTDGDGVCNDEELFGCTDEMGCNYIPGATQNANCIYPFLNAPDCMDGAGACGEGTHWDVASQTCVVTNPSDSNFDGCVQLSDLLDLLGAYGTCEWQCGDPMSYQGYDYETVLIGEQCWFAENVRYLPSVSPADLGSEDDGLPHAYVTGYSGTDIYEAASTENHLTYGALYNFAAVIQWQLCPSGWHVPSDGDWASSLDAPNWNATELRSLTWNGTNQSGFNALPGGFRDAGGFFNESYGADFWTSTEFDASFAERRYILTTSEALEGTNDPRWKSHAFSVRCMKDAE